MRKVRAPRGKDAGQFPVEATLRKVQQKYTARHMNDFDLDYDFDYDFDLDLDYDLDYDLDFDLDFDLN